MPVWRGAHRHHHPQPLDLLLTSRSGDPWQPDRWGTDPRKAMPGDHRHRCLSNHCSAWHSHRTAREEAQQSLCLADGLWRDHLCAEGGPHRAESGTVSPENLGVCRWSYGRVHPGIRCPASLWCICGPRAPSAVIGPGGSDTMETWHPTKICQALTGQRWGDSGSMWEGGDGKIRGTSGGHQRPHRTQPEVFSRWSAYSQDPSPSEAERTCPHHECDQPGPGAEWRHRCRTWRASHVRRKHQWPEARTTTEARALQTTEGSDSCTTPHHRPSYRPTADFEPSAPWHPRVLSSSAVNRGWPPDIWLTWSNARLSHINKVQRTLRVSFFSWKQWAPSCQD